MMIDISVYDKKTNSYYIVVDQSVVYSLSLTKEEYEHLCQRFLLNNPVWVQSFGKVLGGTGIYGARLGLSECPQPICDYTWNWLLSQKDRWVLNTDKSFDLILWNMNARTTKLAEEFIERTKYKPKVRHTDNSDQKPSNTRPEPVPPRRRTQPKQTFFQRIFK